MKVLDLFSGIGGFSLGLERAGMETMAFCEIEPFCQQVLKKHWPDTPVFTDIRNLSAHDLPEKPDVICGGYPCQPFSVAGKQRGKEDDRHLWPQMYRLIQECQPAWVIAENVAGHINMGLDDVLFDLEAAGYEAQPFVIPACALNAPHRRDRIWIVGHTEHHGSPAAALKGKPGQAGSGTQEGSDTTIEPSGTGRPQNNGTLADPESERVQGCEARGKQKPSAHARKKLSLREGEGSWQAQWQTEPEVGRVVDGVPNRVDRIKSLGNAVVPQIPELIGKAIMEASCQ